MPLKKRFLALLLSFFVVAPLSAHDNADIVSLVKQHRDSVVSVHGVSKQASRRNSNVPFDFFSPFSPELFGKPKQPRQQPRRAPPVSSIGSGFIIEADGHILTNAHVVDGLDDIIVSTADGREFPAKVIGSDKLTDIALLKVESGEPLQAIKVGDSDAINAGEYVIAIGSPYGLDQTVTGGIISAVHRRLPTEHYVPFIQTDAAVNPGNSGGPLINTKGMVIGINSQILSPIKAFAGVSFAIPINEAMDIQRRLREHGVVRRGRLGVYFRPVREADVTAFGLKSKKGALIQEVVKGSAAETAGLLSGDVLLSVNAEEISDSVDLAGIIGRLEPGEEVQLKFSREGKIMVLTAVLDAIASEEVPAAALFGLRVEDLTAEIRRQTGVQTGVILIDVEYGENTPEDIGQLQRGDIITHVIVNRRQQVVTGKDEFVRILQGVQETAIALRVWRNGRRLIITINLNR